MMQPDAGTARHDAVAWGYARAADQLGVDIIQNCEVLDYLWSGDRVVGVKTTRGDIGAGKVAAAVAGHTSVLAQKAGLRLPIESHVLQAFVSESIKPVVHHVVVWSATYFYVSQSDKGGLVFGGHIDRYNSYAQRGNLANIAETTQGLASLIPFAARLRLLRHWGGIMDMTPDGSPIITTTPVPGLYLNGGWCYGGFKATPASGWCFAHTIANDAPHAYSAGFTMDRFARAGTSTRPGTVLTTICSRERPHHAENPLPLLRRTRPRRVQLLRRRHQGLSAAGCRAPRCLGRSRLHAQQPQGRAHVEFWQHTLACRRWLVVRRNTVTHDILAVMPARERPQWHER
jgi:hypothetical protein